MGTVSGLDRAEGVLGALAGLGGRLLVKPETPPPLDLESLIRENLGWLSAWLRGRVGDPELAADLCQEAFLKALRRSSDLRDPSRFPAWLYRIAENVVRDHLRSEARRRGRVVFTDQIEKLEPTPPAADLALSEEAEKLLEDIRALPPRFREPLLLRHSRGLSYREIGRLLGITENAVQVRIFRARKMLRAKRLEDRNRDVGMTT